MMTEEKKPTHRTFTIKVIYWNDGVIYVIHKETTGQQLRKRFKIRKSSKKLENEEKRYTHTHAQTKKSNWI